MKHLVSGCLDALLAYQITPLAPWHLNMCICVRESVRFGFFVEKCVLISKWPSIFSKKETQNFQFCLSVRKDTMLQDIQGASNTAQTKEAVSRRRSLEKQSAPICRLLFKDQPLGASTEHPFVQHPDDPQLLQPNSPTEGWALDKLPWRLNFHEAWVVLIRGKDIQSILDWPVWIR